MAIININISVPDDQVKRVLDSVAKYYGYPVAINNPETLEKYIVRTGGRDGYSELVPNPQTKLEFTKQQVRNVLAHAVKQQAIIDAQNIARETAVIDVSTNVPIDVS